MSKKKKFDFGGYATKNDLKCTDGRIIRKGAFKHNDGKTVPLVWQHLHNDPTNFLGHAVLEDREDGVYAQAFFNNSEKAQHAKELVAHGDIKALSIYANELKEKAKEVLHGDIKEVSLVIAGANPGARIDNVILAHSDEPIVEEAVIYNSQNIELIHSEGSDEGEVEDIQHNDGKTVQEVYDTLNEDQKELFFAVASKVADEGEVEHKDGEEGEKDMKHVDDKGGAEVKKNVFSSTGETYEEGKALTHAQKVDLFKAAVEMGSLQKAIIAHAGTYGIDNIEILFPEAKAVGPIEWEKRNTEWVNEILKGVRKVPFSKIKSMYADITADEARAKGYIKGDEKFEEVFPIFKRETSPATIYKKQKLDKDDIEDIVDFDVVAWLRAEMRMMLDEERARAYLVGDGRSVTAPDKIDASKIRPIYGDDDKYTVKVLIDADKTAQEELELIMDAMENYKGSGSPTLYTTMKRMNAWKKIKDENRNYMFRNLQEIADFIGVKKIMDVEILQNITRDVAGTDYDLIGLIVNLRDYTTGANRGGKVNDYHQFDIDFNQEKYLMETRCSGALTKIYSAVQIEKAQAAG